MVFCVDVQTCLNSPRSLSRACDVEASARGNRLLGRRRIDRTDEETSYQENQEASNQEHKEASHREHQEARKYEHQGTSNQDKQEASNH